MTDTPSQSPSKKGSMAAATLNMYLEEIFQVTVREHQPAHYSYLGEDYGDLLNSSNISAVIFEKINGNSRDLLSAVTYLFSCYKRLLQKESTILQSCQNELLNCKVQLISFVASCLLDNEIFGQKSMRSISEFAQIFFDDTSIASTHFLREVIEDLEKQKCLDQVCNKLFDHAYGALQPVQTTQTDQQVFLFLQARPSINLFGLFDSFAGPMRLVQALVKDKRVAKCFAQCPSFFSERATQLTNIHTQNRMMQQNHPLIIYQHCSGGAALEQHTLLGRLLHLAPTIMDNRFTEMFKDIHRLSRNQYDTKIKECQQLLHVLRCGVADIALSTLKAGGSGREKTLEWLHWLAMGCVEAAKDQPSHLLCPSDGFLINCSDLLLKLSLPILEDIEKTQKVDWEYLQSEQGFLLFPASETKLMSGTTTNNNNTRTHEPTFVTQSFFLCWRVVHLCLIPFCRKYVQVLRGLNHFHSGLAENEPRAVHYFLMKTSFDAQLFDEEFVHMQLVFSGAAVRRLLQALGFLGNDDVDTSWLVTKERTSITEILVLQRLSEHQLDDILSLVLFVAQTRSSQLSRHSGSHCDKLLQPLLNLLVYFLRRPWAVQSPHVRAKLGQVLYHLYLPVKERGQEELYTAERPTDGPHTQLLSSHGASQRFLAPALLLLYGDVEKTGFYEKFSHRRSIMIVLKHLWTLPSHRAAFRGIAQDTQDDSESDSTNIGSNLSFVRFANGLLNETNALVSTTLDKLAEIRKYQLLRANLTEWQSLGEEEQQRMTERHEANENECRGTAGLCLETLDMLKYLTSDEIIRQPFLLDEILPRFTSCLLSVLSRLVGTKSLEIKVDNMEQYNFQPRQMLSEVLSAMCHFCNEEKFYVSVAQDAFYASGVPLQRALQTVGKHNLLTIQQREQMETLVSRVASARTHVVDIDALTAIAPADFLDPILDKLMLDPVFLPSSGVIVDRSTISQHLLNNETDPFNRKPLTLNMVQSCDELRQRISNWMSEQLAKNKEQQEC